MLEESRKLTRREREVEVLKNKLEMDYYEMKKNSYYLNDEIEDRLKRY